jgi:hypothetical protein
MTMDALTVGGVISEVLYNIDKVADLRDPVTQDRLVNFMINRRSFPRGVEKYDEAIGQMLHDGRIPERALDFSRRYSEAEQFEFLKDVYGRIQARKPWPRPAFLKLPVETWDQIGPARAVARIERPTTYFEGKFNKSFDKVPIGDDTIPVILLELRNGGTAAVVGSADPRSTTFTLMQRGDGDPAQLIAHFSDVTGIPPEDIQAL